MPCFHVYQSWLEETRFGCSGKFHLVKYALRKTYCCAEAYHFILSLFVRQVEQIRCAVRKLGFFDMLVAPIIASGEYLQTLLPKSTYVGS